MGFVCCLLKLVGCGSRRLLFKYRNEHRQAIPMMAPPRRWVGEGVCRIALRAHLFEPSDVSVVIGRIRCCKGTPVGVGPFSLEGCVGHEGSSVGAARIGPW